jgi:hypothetical protein
VGFVVDKRHWGRFSLSTSVPLPNFIPPTPPQSPSSIIWGWYNRPIVTAIPSGLSLAPLRIIKKQIKIIVITEYEQGSIFMEAAIDICDVRSSQYLPAHKAQTARNEGQNFDQLKILMMGV